MKNLLVIYIQQLHNILEENDGDMDAIDNTLQSFMLNPLHASWLA